jgi:hypothetical protein
MPKLGRGARERVLKKVMSPGRGTINKCLGLVSTPVLSVRASPEARRDGVRFVGRLTATTSLHQSDLIQAGSKLPAVLGRGETVG